MTRKQRRQRIVRIRHQQKAARLAKKKPQPNRALTRCDVEEMATVVQKFVKSDKEVVAKCSAKIKRSKNWGTIFSPILVLVSIMLGCNMLSVITITLALMPWIGYLIYSEDLPFWERQLQENLDYLQALKNRLQQFDINNSTCAV